MKTLGMLTIAASLLALNPKSAREDSRVITAQAPHSPLYRAVIGPHQP